MIARFQALCLGIMHYYSLYGQKMANFIKAWCVASE